MRVVGIDCEMVGVGPGGRSSVLARVSIVDEDKKVLLDSFVSPEEYVTDYRTEKSGVRPEDLKGAPDFQHSEVRSILKDKIVVGHEVGEDFRVIQYFPPTAHVRNTAEFFHDFKRNRTPSLKDLAEQKLGWSIQTGEHSSVQDASAALQLYLNNRREWDEEVEKFEKIKKCLGNTTSLSTLLEAYRGRERGVSLVGKIGGIRRNVKPGLTFFDLRVESYQVQVMAGGMMHQVTQGLQAGDIVRVQGATGSNRRDQPLVTACQITRFEEN